MRAAMTDRTITRSVGDEPLPGYRLIAPLGRGGFGEVWKCLAPGGLQKAIKFVAEDAADRAEGRTPLRTEYEAFLRVKGIRHPFLLMLERVELVQGVLVIQVFYGATQPCPHSRRITRPEFLHLAARAGSMGTT